MSVLSKKETFEEWFAELGETLNGALGEQVPVTLEDYENHRKEEARKAAQLHSDSVEVQSSGDPFIDRIDKELAAHTGHIAFLQKLDLELSTS